jgi:hypothetical protein
VNTAKHMVDMGRLSEATYCFLSFVDIQAEGQDATS